MTATPTPSPWPAPTLADAAVLPPEEQATVQPPRLTVASLVSTARRFSNRTERAEHAAMKQEQRIRDELTDLPAGWFVLHSLDVGELWNDGNHGNDSTNLDHVVIGPGGVFAIEVQHRSGAKVWVSEHELTIDGQNCGDLRRARSQARRSSGRLSDACGFAVTVQAVLVLIGAGTMQTLSRPAEVHVRTEHDLRDWLCRQPSRLDAEVVSTIHECVRRADRKELPPPVAPGG